MDYETLERVGQILPPLEQAKLLWGEGFPIPVDLSTTLMAQGFNVPELEARYSL